eukprot:gene26659-32744_t
MQADEEQAIELFNQALLEQDGVQQAQLIHQLKEIVLKKRPALLPTFFPQFIELKVYRSPMLRKTLAELMEHVGMTSESFLTESINCISYLIEDEMVTVSKKALTSGKALFKHTFKLAAEQGRGPKYRQAVEDAWLAAVDLKNKAVHLCTHAENDGVHLLAVKFVEAVIFTYSNVDRGTDELLLEGGGRLRGSHRLLNAKDLRREATELLDKALAGQLAPPGGLELSGPVVIVLINASSSLARQRSEYFPKVLTVLLRLAKEAPGTEGATAASVTRALKDALINILKTTRVVGPWKDKVVRALRALSSGEDDSRKLESALRHVERQAAREVK